MNGGAAALQYITSQWRTVSRQAKRQHFSADSRQKERTRVVGKLAKRRDGRLTYAKMQVGGGGSQAMGHVQAGSGVAQQRLACATPPLPSITRALDSQGEMNKRARPAVSTKRSGHDSKLIPQPCVPCSLEIAPPNPSPALPRYHYRRNPFCQNRTGITRRPKMQISSCDLAYYVYPW